MRKHEYIAAAASILTFLLLCRIFSGAPENAGPLAWLSPGAAVNGISFTLAFAAGLPPYVAMGLAIVLMIAVPYGVYRLTRWVLTRRIRKVEE